MRVEAQRTTWHSCVSPGPVNYDAAHSSGGEQDTEPHRRSSSHRQAGGRVEREMGEAMTTSPLVPVSTDFLPLVRRLQAMRSIGPSVWLQSIKVEPALASHLKVSSTVTDSPLCMTPTEKLFRR